MLFLPLPMSLLAKILIMAGTNHGGIYLTIIHVTEDEEKVEAPSLPLILLQSVKFVVKVATEPSNVDIALIMTSKRHNNSPPPSLRHRPSNRMLISVQRLELLIIWLLIFRTWICKLPLTVAKIKYNFTNQRWNRFAPHQYWYLSLISLPRKSSL